MTIEEAMLKDSGNWRILVGTGESLTEFQKKEYIFPVLVNGKHHFPQWDKRLLTSYVSMQKWILIYNVFQSFIDVLQ